MIHLTRSGSTHSARQRGNVIATALIVLAISIFMAAGFWQVQRAHYKDELKDRAEALMHEPPIEISAARLEAAVVEFHPVHANGTWLPDKTIFLDNKVLDGVVGYHVITPLRIAGGNTALLVNRGWVPAPPLRSELPRVFTPGGPVDIAGVARAPTNRFLELSGNVREGQQQRIWQNLTIGRFGSWSGLELQPVVVYQQNESADGLKRVPTAPEASGLGADRHRGYALTWFGLAAVTLVLGIALKLKGNRNR